jgi:lysophospholipase L1-like esterase
MKRRKMNPAAIVFVVFAMLLATGIKVVHGNALNQEPYICSSEIKVMPLGDSITTGKYSGNDTSDSPQGAEDDIGYRKDLWDLLSAHGFTVDFVGTQSNGSTFPFIDPDHEGHNGITDTEIADNIYNDGGADWLSQNPPDVILLHVGTNNLDADPSGVERILNEIDEYESENNRRVIVILARIIDMVPNNPVVNQFNYNIEAMAAARAEYGSDLFMVDMEDGAGITYSLWPGDPGGDMIDTLHPYATGYSKMAAVWMSAFKNLCNVVYLPVVSSSSWELEI